MKRLGFPPETYATLDTDAVEDFVFATAASKGFFFNSLETIATVQKWRPRNTIIYYDLGLKPRQVQELSTLCNVIHVKFNFSQYPDHVRDLHTYAWKPLVIWVSQLLSHLQIQ